MIRKRTTKRKAVTSECESTSEEESPENNQNQMFDSKNTIKEDCKINVREFPSPTFNIHIHVPYYNTSGSKIYLPRIQPEIHLHFDEIAKKLDINKSDHVLEDCFRIFQNILPQTSPKFGDVKLYFGNNSKERNEDTEKGNRTPSSTRHCEDDRHLKESQINEEAQIKVTKNNKKIHSHDSPKNRSKEKVERTSTSDSLSKYKELKMKKAVVVLTDICKSKAWKKAVASNLDEPQNYDNSSVPTAYQLENCKEKEILNISVKQETKSLDSCSPTVKNFGNLDNDCGIDKVEEIIVATSTFQESFDIHNKSLTALAEGCSFSEILNRFKLKNRSSPSDTSVQSVNIVNEVGSDHKAIIGCNSFEENNKVDLHSVIEINESLHNFYPPKEEVLSLESEDDIEIVEESSPENYSEIVSDNSSVISEQDFDLEAIKGFSEIIELDSSVTKNCDNDKSFGDVEHIDLHLKEMKRKNQTNPRGNKKIKVSEKKSKSNSNLKSPSDRKSKSEDETPTKKESKWPPTEDYIPLNGSGPTKFAVAPLELVNPYSSHAAKNFKQNMLFGNRIKRFSTSDQLKMYQLKQQAAKSQSYNS